MKVLYASGYTNDALARHRVMVPGVVLLRKLFAPVAIARKVRDVLDQMA